MEVMLKIALTINQHKLHDIPYLIWMDNQHSLSVELLHLVGCHQVGHAHRLPAGFTLPQHRVQGRQQRSDVSLLPLNPVQDLQYDSKTNLYYFFCEKKQPAFEAKKLLSEVKL